VLVPPLILQPTIENAIWHGLVSKEMRGQIIIVIKAEKDLLKIAIEDNGEGQGQIEQSDEVNLPQRKSFGISITRKRIEVLNKEYKSEGYFNLEFLQG